MEQTLEGFVAKKRTLTDKKTGELKEYVDLVVTSLDNDNHSQVVRVESVKCACKQFDHVFFKVDKMEGKKKNLDGTEYAWSFYRFIADQSYMLQAAGNGGSMVGAGKK